MHVDESDLTRRALAGYFRSGGTVQPVKTEVTEHDGKLYVVLYAPPKMYVILDAPPMQDVLAIYRVRNDGMLKRLRRWPAELIPG